MAILNLRNVPDDLAATLKSEAALVGITLHNYCVAILRQRRPVAMTAKFAGVFAEAGEIAPTIEALDSEKISIVPIAVPEAVWAAHKYLQERMDEAMGATGVSPEGLAALDKAKLYVSSDALARGRGKHGVAEYKSRRSKC